MSSQADVPGYGEGKADLGRISQVASLALSGLSWRTLHWLELGTPGAAGQVPPGGYPPHSRALCLVCVENASPLEIAHPPSRPLQPSS